MTNGFSSAVSRLFRAFHRGHDSDPAHDDTASSSSSTGGSAVTNVSSFVLLAAATGRSPPKHTRLPSGFTRHVRHLVDYVSLLVKLRASSSTSASATARRHSAAAKALDRVAQQLRARGDNDQSGSRAMPLNAALELLLTVWECVLQCLDLSRALTQAGASASGGASQSPTERLSSCSSTSSTSADDAVRLEVSARRLLALLIQQREFDLALMALGRGECNVHQNDGARKRSTHDGTRPDELRVSMRSSRRGSVVGKRPAVPRPLPSKRDVSNTSDAPLCVLSKKYLDLHQTTLRQLQDAHATSTECFDDRHTTDTVSDAALLLQLLAASYVRVPALRDAILTSFQKFTDTSDGRRRRLQTRELRRQRDAAGLTSIAAATIVRGRSVTLLDEVNVALFRWTQSLNSKCQGGVAPFNRDGFWTRETRHVATAMHEPKFQRVFLARLVDHFMTIGGAGGIDWKCLPGATVLKEAVLTMTESIFTMQLRAAELSLLEKQDAAVGSDGEGSALKSEIKLSRQTSALSTADDWTVGLFLKQTMRVLACNPPFIHDWMMTILHNTNAMVSYHVTLCLRYLSQLLTEFPAYFTNDCSASAAVLLQVFTQLLKSDHFEILRNTELFLMKHFAGFSVTLRESLVAVFATEFQRLFLHWNRDVRFCFYHMLLYLTFPGNRLVLGAKSDELLMGAAASYLFEVPGLVRNSSSPMAVQWDAFDAPLCELIAYVNRTAKHHTPPKSLAASSASAHGSSMGAMLKPRPGRHDTSATRTSMTLRPKPSARASLSTRPSSHYGRASLAAAQTASAPAMPKCASMSALPLPTTTTTSMNLTPSTPAWIQALPVSTAQRSVHEYRRHVETYFAYARQISVHDAVPTPMLQAATKA